MANRKIPANFGLRSTRTVNKMDVLLTGRPSKVNIRDLKKKFLEKL